MATRAIQFLKKTGVSPVLMESSLLKYKRVAINGGKRGLMLKMNPHDIASVLKCEVMQLS